MSKLEKEEIRKIVIDTMEEMSRNTANILFDNIENCIDETQEIKDDMRMQQYVLDIMIPISTAYQMSMFTTAHILYKLLGE